MPDESMELFSTRFVANIDFNKAIRDADSLDKQLDRIIDKIRFLGTAGVGYINALSAAMVRLAATGIGGMPLQLGAVGTGPPMGATGAPQSRLPGAPLALPAFTPYQTPTTFLPPSTTPRPISAAGVVGDPWALASRGGPPSIVPFGGGSPPMLPPGGGGGGRPPGGPPPGGGGPWYNWALPNPNYTPYTPMPFTPYTPVMPWNARRVGQAVGGAGQMWHQYIGAGSRQMTGGMGQFGRAFSPYNMMRYASMLYIGQNVANFGRFVGQSTIGQAQYLEEREELLENALMSERYDINRPEAERWARNLTTANYFAGMPVTAAEMGLSRVELAEQFRQLAPIIRLTADTRSEFQSGLQTGALARALLVARDPVQGTRGATVALSELYSGGPDRFRSLSLRFEIPRNRLREIETEMGGPGAADPGQIVIQMLREMGFGPEYLTRRAGTLSGQFERTGALAANFRIDLFQNSMERVRTQITSLNDAFEAFLDSDAGDRFLDQFDKILGTITGFIVDQPLGVFTRMFAAEGAMPTSRLGQSISEFMPRRGGSFVNAEGELTGAATAFREAAEVITGRALEQALRMPQFNPGSALAMQGTGLALGGIAASGLIDRMLFRGAMGQAARTAGQAGLRAGAAVAGPALAGAAGLMVPLGLLTAAGFGVAGYLQSRNLSRDWSIFNQNNPGIAEQLGVDPNISGRELFGDRLVTWLRRGAWGLGLGDQFFGSPDRDPLTSQYQILHEELPRASAVANLRQFAATISTDTTDRNVVRARVQEALSQMVQNNPMIAQNMVQFGDIVGQVMEIYDPNDRTIAGNAMASAALWQAVTGSADLMLGGEPFMTREDILKQIGAEGENLAGGASDLWTRVLGVAGGDQEEGLRLLEQMLDSLVATEANTAESAEALNAYTGIRPSGAGDIFTGFTTDPDMRMIRRTGTAIAGLGSGGASGTATAHEHLSDSVSATFKPQAFGNYVGGTVTSGFGMRDERFHYGVDYVSDSGEVIAPAAGTVEYLTTDEDYAKYAHMLPGGKRVYGNTALLHDPYGASISSYSHLSDETMARFNEGPVDQGEAFGVMGATGQVRSSYGGSGAHVHQELWISDGAGGFEKVNPMHTEEWYQVGVGQVGRAAEGGSGTVNINLGGMTFEIQPGNVEDMVDEILDSGAMRQVLIDALADGLAKDSVAANAIVSSAERGRNRRGTTG